MCELMDILINSRGESFHNVYNYIIILLINYTLIKLKNKVINGTKIVKMVNVRLCVVYSNLKKNETNGFSSKISGNTSLYLSTLPSIQI